MLSTANWFFWALMSAVFAALTAIFAKIGVEAVDADLATLIRTIVIVGLLGLFVWMTDKWSNPLVLPGRTLVFLVFSALAAAASWVCYFRALKLGDVAQVAPVDKLSLVLVAVFAFIFLGERPAGREWLGIVLVVAGVVLMALRR